MHRTFSGYRWVSLRQHKHCAGAGTGIIDGASFVGVCQLRQRWENSPFFLEFTDCANSVLDNIAHFSCFMHIDFQSTKLGMFSSVFQEKAYQKSCSPLLWGKGRKISHCLLKKVFLVLSPWKLCKSKLEKLAFIYGKEDVAWLELDAGGWLWFWFRFYF